MIAGEDKPLLSWNLKSSEIATVERMYIPRAQRGKGLGRRIYEHFEERLPSGVQRIELWAMDSEAVKFWTKMGFQPMYPELEMLLNVDSSGLTMFKDLPQKH